MTSEQEKARGVVGKFIIITLDLTEAKQCALICVDEIINSHYKLLGGVNNTTYNYWQQVKQEINDI